MKTSTLGLPLAVTALAMACGPAQCEWRVHPGDGYSEEVRVWASPKESGMDFSWSGKANARHEAEGHGILEWFKPAEARPEVGLIYSGEMKSGRRHGRGVALHRSGSKYSGQWRENLKEGQGEFWYQNGDYYSGSFQNDVMHGPGRYVSADGTIFEGTFVADEREGPGIVLYPDGRRYTSTWSAGKDVNAKDALVAARPYAVVGVDVRRYALNGEVFAKGEGTPGEHFLTYRGRFADGDFVIEPDWPYWVAWSKGGPVADDSDFVVGVFPVFLDIRVYNPSKEKLVIRRAEAVVEEGFPDREPILRLHDASTSGGVTCEIVNFHANRVDDCEVAFNIVPPGAEPSFESYRFVEKVGPFSESARFSLARAMEALGMNASAIASIEKIGDDSSLRATVEQRAKDWIGPFSKFAQEGYASGLVEGEVRLTWTDYSGSRQSKRVKFRFHKTFYLFGAEMAVGGAPSGKYDLYLETEGKDYVVPFAYKRTIDPGENDRFALEIASESSSYQSFRVRLTTSDGREIVSPRCRMHFLVPLKFSWKEGYVIEED